MRETNRTVVFIENALLILTLRQPYSLFLSVQQMALLCKNVKFHSEYVHPLYLSMCLCMLAFLGLFTVACYCIVCMDLHSIFGVCAMGSILYLQG